VILGLRAVTSLIEGRRKHGHRTFARNNGENGTANAALQISLEPISIS